MNRWSELAARASLFAGFVVLLSACGGGAEGKAGSPQASSDSPPPKGAVVNRDYAFALYPVEGATLFNSETVKAMHAQGSAGMQMGENWAGVVIVERLPNTSLADYAGLLKRSWGDDARHIEKESKVRYAGQDAIHVVRTSTTGQQTIRVFNNFFVREGFGYQVVAWQYVGQRGAPDAFFSSFRLIDADVPGPDSTPQGDWFGPTYQVVDNVFLGLLSGTKVRPQGGWSFVAEDERQHVNADAELLMHHRSSGAYVMIVPDRIRASDQPAYRKGTAAAVAGQYGNAQGAGKPLPAFGRELPSSFYQDPTLHVHEAVDCQGDTCVRYRLWYPRGAAREVARWTEAQMPWIERLDGETRSHLVRALGAWPVWTGLHSAFRNGLFRDTQYGVELRLPEGAWNVASPSDQAIFDATDAASNTQLWVVAEPGVKSGGYHRDVSKDLMGERAQRTSPLGGWTVSTGVTKVMEGVYLPTALATRVENKTAFRLVLVGMNATKKGIRNLVRSATLFPPQTSPMAQRGVRWTDHRLGVSLELPSGRWTYKPAKHDQVSSVHGWEADGAKVALAIVTGLGQSNEERLEFLMGFIKGASKNMTADYLGEVDFAGTVGFAYTGTNAGGQKFRTYAAFVDNRLIALIAPDTVIDSIAGSVAAHAELPPRR